MRHGYAPVGELLITHVSLWCIYWALLTLMIVSLGWAMGIPLLSVSAMVGALVATAIVIFSLQRRNVLKKQIAQVVGAIIVIVVVCLLLARTSHDFSADGQTYQQQAIIALLRGWNPLSQTHYPGPFSIWISHYAKGPWILSAALASVGSIEDGKAITWLFAISAGILAYGLFKVRFGLGRNKALLSAILIACNPVFSSQIQTFYVDGLLNSVITLAIVAAIYLVSAPSPFLQGAVAASLVIALNLKFTAGPFVFVILAFIGLWCFVSRRRVAAMQIVVAVSGGLLVGGLIATNPYLTNLHDHHNPFYPLAGEGKVDILTSNGGAEFLSQNRFLKLVTSLTSESNNAEPSQTLRSGAAVLKIPGVIKSSELKSFYSATDLRMGGFGPWASLAICGAILYVLLAFRRKRFDIHSDEFLVVAATIGLVASAFIMADMWWARYAPHLWTALVLIVVFACSLSQTSRLRFLGASMLAILTINSAVILMLAVGNRAVMETDFQAQIASLKILSTATPVLVEIDLDSVRLRLQNQHVVFREGLIGDCANVDNVRGSTTKMCIPTEALPVYRKGSAHLAKLLGRSTNMELHATLP